MKLKEIKPGMVIHCKNSEEKNLLLEEAERLGYVWYGTKGKPTERSVYAIGDTIHFYDAGTTAFSADYKHITHSSCIGDPAIEFSDLIIPEMSAEEVLQICSEICRSGSCDICPMGEEYCFSETESDKKKIVLLNHIQTRKKSLKSVRSGNPTIRRRSQKSNGYIEYSD